MAVATKRDFSISYGLQTDKTGTSTGNTLFVDQVNDRVGVGTSGPSAKFEVDGSCIIGSDLGTGGTLVAFKNRNSLYSQDLYLKYDSSKNISLEGGSSNGGLINDFGNNGYTWRINSTEILRLNSTGLILNGGSIYGDDDATESLTIQSTSGNSNHSRIEIGTNEGSDNGGIHFYTAGATFATRRITVKGTTGNVGINNTNPAYTLDVSGDINFTGGLYKNGAEYYASRWTLTGSDIYRLSKVGINESNPQSQLSVNGYITESTDSGTTYWNVVTQQDIGTDANQVPLNQYLGKLAFLDDFSPNGLRREGGSSDDVVVDSSGNVGFGTNNPNSKLHVEEGKIEVSRFAGSYAGNAVNSQTCLLTHPGSSAAPGSGSAISIIGGTGSATSIFFGDTADADIGSISYLHPTNHMAFTVNANERLRIESDGLIKAGVAFSSTSYGNERFLIDAEGQTNAAADTSLVSIGEDVDGSANPSITLYRRTGSTLYESYAWRITNTLNSLDFKYAGVALPGSHSFSSPTIRITSSGNVGIADTNPDQKLVVAGNIRTTGSLYGPSNFIIDPSTVGDDTGTVEIKGNLVVQGTTTTVNSTTVDLDHLSLGDNEIANFGNSNDLQIYHDGPTNRTIIDDSSGGFKVQSDGNISFTKGATENLAVFEVDGAVELYYDNSQKFQTTSDGVRIGSASAPIDINAYETLNNGTLSFEGSAGQLFSITNSLTSGSIFSVNDVSGIPSIDVDADGTITLAEFGGNTGIGTSNPATKLHVIGTIRMSAVPGTNNNAQQPVLHQTADGDIDGGSSLTFNPAEDALYVNGMYINTNTVRASANGPLTLNTANASSTISLYVGTADIYSKGNFRPDTDNTYDLGSASFRWANIYSADLQLSNEGSHNDVDGTWGKYTIQEGEEDLFLINRRSGKKYKFVLKEV